jgi:hypothetical protein
MIDLLLIYFAPVTENSCWSTGEQVSLDLLLLEHGDKSHEFVIEAVTVSGLR